MSSSQRSSEKAAPSAILLSIKPEYAERILRGTKRFEYRRAAFKRHVSLVVIYATAPVCMVVGEFEIDRVIQDDPASVWAQTGAQGGVSESFYQEYFRDRPMAVAIGVKRARRYRRQLALAHLTASPPPQSFMYL